MKLGEYRTHLKEKPNKLDVKLSVYEPIDSKKGYVDLEIDVITNNTVYLRPIKEE